MGASKLCIVGESGVGKTTLVNLLSEKEFSDVRRPTIGVAVERVEVEHDTLAVWDLAGQKRFQFMWEEFLRGTKLTVVVTDSSLKNVQETKAIVDRLRSGKDENIIAIANKQDLGGRMCPEEIQQHLGIPTYGMVALERQNEDALKKILMNQIR
jgi:small GTP-binding protein